MRHVLSLFVSRQSDHRAVFATFAAGLARTLRHSGRRARIRAVES